MTDVQVLYDGPIVKLEDARNLGLMKYFTGLPCKHGHVCERYTVKNTCVECQRVNGIKFREKNPNYHSDYIAENGRKFYRQCPDSSRAYRQNNREQYASYTRARRAKIKMSEGEHTRSDVYEILESQEMKCVYCDADLNEVGYHVDHIMPIKLGGSNWPENLQCLCPTCNVRKSAKHPDVWHAEIGRFDLIGGASL